MRVGWCQVRQGVRPDIVTGSVALLVPVRGGSTLPKTNTEPHGSPGRVRSLNGHGSRISPTERVQDYKGNERTFYHFR